MSAKPYIVYPDTANSAVSPEGGVVNKYISEPDQVSFGVIDFAPGLFRALHHHHTWELIIVDNSSEGPGYTFFDGHWWRVDPGGAVFVPKGCSHAWSSGKNNGFKMLWVYGGTREEAGRVWEESFETARPITPEEERNAPRWQPGAV